MQIDAPTATLLAGITAGVIGILSAIVSHLNLRVQIHRSEREAERQRQHQISISTIPKTLEATETVAAILYSAQATGKISGAQTEAAIRSLIWLPNQQREKVALALSRMASSGSTIGAEVKEAHASLLNFAQNLTTNK